jgi:hypothetical protein
MLMRMGRQLQLVAIRDSFIVTLELLYFYSCSEYDLHIKKLHCMNEQAF